MEPKQIIRFLKKRKNHLNEISSFEVKKPLIFQVLGSDFSIAICAQMNWLWRVWWKNSLGTKNFQTGGEKSTLDFW